MNSIVVFCGSSSGTEKDFEVNANLLGRKLAEHNIALVYGGASVGLMGQVADGTIAGKGKVIGVLPRFLNSKEIAHTGLTELILVDSMHDRKERMNQLCEGAIALPGGFGTLEELFEMLTWAQLGLHKKPIGILNINGFYDDLLTLLDSMVKKGFLKEINRQMILVSNDIEKLLNKMESYVAPDVKKWISKEDI